MPIFQAIGILKGKITQSQSDEYRFLIEINNVSYEIKTYHTSKCTREKLIKHIQENTSPARIMVYPRLKIDPDTAKQKVKFSLANFITTEDNSKLVGILSDNEFILRGIYKKVAGFKDPCITVFKNKDKRNELLFEKHLSKGKTKYFLPMNIPVKWKDAVITPYDARDSEIQQKYFVSLKAKFSAKKSTFTYHSLLDAPTNEIPQAIFVEPEQDLKTEETYIMSNF